MLGSMNKPIAGVPEAGWDQQLTDLEGGVLQSRAWAVFQQALGNIVYHASGDGWVWLAVVRRGRGVSYLYVPYGPVARSAKALAAALDGLTDLGRSLGLDFVRFEPARPAAPEALRRLGAHAIAEVQPQRTLLLDLTKPEADLRAGISQSNRNLVNTAEQRGITITPLPNPSPEDAKLFLDMLRDTVKRGGFVPYPESYYRQTLQVLGAEGLVTLFVAAVEGRPVASAVALDFAGTRHYLHAAAFQDLNRQHKTAVPLLWAMITNAKQQGLSRFDFWGIASTDDPDHPRAGLTRFKRSFGGELKEYSGAWELPIKRTKYKVYRLAKRVLKSRTS